MIIMTVAKKNEILSHIKGAKEVLHWSKKRIKTFVQRYLDKKITDIRFEELYIESKQPIKKKKKKQLPADLVDTFMIQFPNYTKKEVMKMSIQEINDSLSDLGTLVRMFPKRRPMLIQESFVKIDTKGDNMFQMNYPKSNNIKNKV
jgi:hypothetical protein